MVILWCNPYFSSNVLILLLQKWVPRSLTGDLGILNIKNIVLIVNSMYWFPLDMGKGPKVYSSDDEDFNQQYGCKRHFAPPSSVPFKLTFITCLAPFISILKECRQIESTIKDFPYSPLMPKVSSTFLGMTMFEEASFDPLQTRTSEEHDLNIASQGKVHPMCRNEIPYSACSFGKHHSCLGNLPQLDSN